MKRDMRKWPSGGHLSRANCCIYLWFVATEGAKTVLCDDSRHAGRTVLWLRVHKLATSANGKTSVECNVSRGQCVRPIVSSFWQSDRRKLRVADGVNYIFINQCLASRAQWTHFLTTCACVGLITNREERECLKIILKRLNARRENYWLVLIKIEAKVRLNFVCFRFKYVTPFILISFQHNGISVEFMKRTTNTYMHLSFIKVNTFLWYSTCISYKINLIFL